MPQSGTEATAARPGQYAWLRQQAGESAEGGVPSAEPVAVLTSAVTGAGLKELLVQVERKVSFAKTICYGRYLCAHGLNVQRIFVFQGDEGKHGNIPRTHPVSVRCNGAYSRSQPVKLCCRQ